MGSDYKILYKEYEQLQAAFGWAPSESRKLTYRERKHWVKRYVYQLEQQYQQMHLANNSDQTVMSSGHGVTFGGKPFRL